MRYAIALAITVPKDLRRSPGAFGHRFEFRPADRGMADARAEAAIRSRQDVLAAEQFCVADEALRDQIGVFDKVAAMADDARAILATVTVNECIHISWYEQMHENENWKNSQIYRKQVIR